MAGAPKKEFLDKSISPALEDIMEERKTVIFSPTDEKNYVRITSDEEEGKIKYTCQVISPITAEGDPIGAVMLLSKEPGKTMGDLEVKVAETASGFLARQMEH